MCEQFKKQYTLSGGDAPPKTVSVVVGYVGRHQTEDGFGCAVSRSYVGVSRDDGFACGMKLTGDGHEYLIDTVADAGRERMLCLSETEVWKGVSYGA